MPRNREAHRQETTRIMEQEKMWATQAVYRWGEKISKVCQVGKDLDA